MSISAGLFVAAAVFGSFAAAAQDFSVPCGSGEIGRGTVSRVIEGRSFVLDDGREVRLAAIEVPPQPRAQEIDAAPSGAAAQQALDALADRNRQARVMAGLCTWYGQITRAVRN